MILNKQTSFGISGLCRFALFSTTWKIKEGNQEDRSGRIQFEICIWHFQYLKKTRLIKSFFFLQLWEGQITLVHTFNIVGLMHLKASCHLPKTLKEEEEEYKVTQIKHTQNVCRCMLGLANMLNAKLGSCMGPFCCLWLLIPVTFVTAEPPSAQHVWKLWGAQCDRQAEWTA